jgi:hypothetical protein
VSGEGRQACASRCPGLLYPPVQHVFVDSRTRGYLAYRLFMLPCKRCRFGLEFLRVYPPFFIFLFLLFYCILHLSLWSSGRLGPLSMIMGVGTEGIDALGFGDSR